MTVDSSPGHGTRVAGRAPVAHGRRLSVGRPPHRFAAGAHPAEQAGGLPCPAAPHEQPAMHDDLAAARRSPAAHRASHWTSSAASGSSRRLTPDVPVALVVAAAGHGKSTAVAEWADHDPRPTVWVSAPTARRHPRPRCSRALADALDAARRATGGRPRGVLARLRQPRSLVLDDFGHVRRRRRSRRSSELADRLPGGSRLTIVSRGVPALPLGRLRARRRMVELRRGDLVMTCGEAYAALRLAGIDAPAEAVEALVRRTEGWPAAIDLAAACAAEADDPAAVLRAFAGEDRLLRRVRPRRGPRGPRRRPSSTSSCAPRCSTACPARCATRSSAARARRRCCTICRGDRPAAPARPRRIAGTATTGCSARRCARGSRSATPPSPRPGTPAPAAGTPRPARSRRRSSMPRPPATRAPRATCCSTTSPRYVDAGGRRPRQPVDRALQPRRGPRASPALALAAATSAWTCGELDRAEHLATVAADGDHERRGPGPRLTELRAGALGDARRGRAGRLTQMADDAARGGRATCRSTAGGSRASHLSRASRWQLLGRARRGAHAAAGGAAAPRSARPTCARCASPSSRSWPTSRGAPDDVAILAARARAQPRAAAAHAAPRTRCSSPSRRDPRRARPGRRGRRATRATRRALLARLVDFVPWYEVEVRVALARAELRLSDVATAKAHLHEAARILRPVADAPVLPRMGRGGVGADRRVLRRGRRRAGADPRGAAGAAAAADAPVVRRDRRAARSSRRTRSRPRPTRCTASSTRRRARPPWRAGASSGCSTASRSCVRARRARSAVEEEEQHGPDAAADIRRRRQLELGEDRVDVLLDRPLGQAERLGDALVARAAGHLGEDLALARAERGERRAACSLSRRAPAPRRPSGRSPSRRGRPR